MSDSTPAGGPQSPPPAQGTAPALAPSGTSLPAAPKPARSPLPLVIVVAAVIALGWFFFHPRENSNEKLATEVTQAIVNNDMRPVEKDFNALRRPLLENRERVGRLSDTLVALGKLKSIKEDTPQGKPTDYHHFQATFERATWVEDMTLDGDGKISAFHVHPSDTVR